jgi:DNA-binding PadR family transcriptional regulator
MGDERRVGRRRPSPPAAPETGIERERHEAAEYALLGLLRDGPCHGYRLAAAFASDGWLAPILRLKMSQMYAYLHKLERQEWLQAHDEASGATHPRHVFAITPAGEDAFDRWLVDPVRATRDVRLDFLVKLAFAVDRNPSLAIELVTRQREAIGARLALLRQQRTAGDAANPLSPRRLALDHRLRQTEATLAWLSELAATLTSVVSSGHCSGTRAPGG